MKRCHRARLLSAAILMVSLGSGRLGAEPLSSMTAESGPTEAVVEARVGEEYAEGTRVGIPKTGVSFVVPQGWRSSLPEDSDMLFLVSNREQGIGMVFLLRNVTPEQVDEHLNEPLPLLHGVVFEPTGELNRFDTRRARSYQSDEYVGRALAVMGPDQNWVMYFLLGQPSQAPLYAPLLEKLADSTRFASSGQPILKEP